MNSQDYRNLQEAYLDVYDSDLREEQEFESWVAELLDEGYDLSDYNWDEMYEIYNEARDPGVKPYPGGARYSLRTQVRQSNEVKPAGEKPPGETSGYGQVSPDGKKDPLKTPAKDERNFANVLAPKPKAFPRIFGTLDPANTRTREITRQMGKPKPEAPRRRVIKASYEPDIYDVILEYLINEGYADTYEAAESIMVNMSEEWRDDILNEAVYGGEPKKPEGPKDTRLVVTNADKKGNTPAYQNFKKGDKRYRAADHMDEATAMAKRGYDEVPIRNKIASQTRGGEFADKATKLADRETYGNKEMKAGREKLARKQRGTFRDTNSSSPGLRGYGHQSSDPAVKAKQDARGNQRARAALTPNERKQLNMESYDLFDYIMEYLITEGYADTNENALVIMANMSEDWRDSIVEGKSDQPLGIMHRFARGVKQKKGEKSEEKYGQDTEGNISGKYLKAQKSKRST